VSVVLYGANELTPDDTGKTSEDTIAEPPKSTPDTPLAEEAKPKKRDWGKMAKALAV